jgi:predicted dehydrogenase
MVAQPFAVPVVLFGWGEWSQKRWFPILIALARWGVINLTVIERCQVAPPELSTLQHEGVLIYMAWESVVKSQMAPIWKVAFVVTNPAAHVQVIDWLLEKVKCVEVIVCEKPCGKNRDQAESVINACRQMRKILLIADHYLLRPPIQHLLRNPQLLLSVGEMVQITATLNESKETGPNQGAIADLLVHLIDLLIILFPGARFVPDAAYVARAQHRPHTEAVNEGVIWISSPFPLDGVHIPC